MRGEVVAHVKKDRATHVALARTCKSLLLEYKPVAFPQVWRPVWAEFRAGAAAYFFHSACRAVFHCMDMGMLRWPGVFRAARLRCLRGRPRDHGCVAWEWGWDMDEPRKHWLLLYDAFDETFTIYSNPAVPAVTNITGPVDTLANVDPADMDRLRQFIARPNRRLPTSHCNHITYFDEDTPM
jgi:hypothetical protein